MRTLIIPVWNQFPRAAALAGMLQAETGNGAVRSDPANREMNRRADRDEGRVGLALPRFVFVAVGELA
jgi:hypothetical protein